MSHACNEFQSDMLLTSGNHKLSRLLKQGQRVILILNLEICYNLFDSKRDAVCSNGVRDKKQWRYKQSMWDLLPATWNF